MIVASSAGVTSGSTTIGVDSSKGAVYEGDGETTICVVFPGGFFEAFGAAVFGFGVAFGAATLAPVLGAPFGAVFAAVVVFGIGVFFTTGVVFAIGAVFGFVEDVRRASFFDTTGVK